MPSNIVLEAELRTITGKSANRRLRRLEQKVPAVIYGGTKEPVTINLFQNKINKALANTAIYSSIITIRIQEFQESVVLKSLQRHPYKSTVILHMDLQRISAKDHITMHVPLHFINEQHAKGVLEGGIITHIMTQIEVRCQAQDLPEFIAVDMINVGLHGMVHLSDLQLPAGVVLTVDPHDKQHNHALVNIHLPRVTISDESETILEPTPDSLNIID